MDLAIDVKVDQNMEAPETQAADRPVDVKVPSSDESMDLDR